MRLSFGNLGWGGAILSILLSLGVAAAAIALVYYANIQVQSWTLVPATVTAVRETQTSDSDGNTSRNFCPTLSFDTTSGQAQEVDSTECANPSKYAVGDTIQVYYNPNNPNQVQIKGGSGQFSSNIGAAVLGLISVLSCASGLVSIVVLVFRGRR